MTHNHSTISIHNHSTLLGLGLENDGKQMISNCLQHTCNSGVITICVITFCVKKVITFCVGKLLHFALIILLHFALILLHFVLVLHFAAIITFCGVTTYLFKLAF